MNIQAMMKQAQALQKDMMKAKKEIDEKEFVGESSLVKITLLGSKDIKSVEIDKNFDLTSDDIEMLEDMITVAFKDALKKIDNECRYDVESMLYAFADKFLDGKDLEKVKEEISMTKLGEMLVEDGIKKGKIEGKEEQAIETAKVAIKEGMSDELITKLTGLTESQISIIRKSINN